MMDNLEMELVPFMKKPVLLGIRFKPSGYDEVFRLCINHLTESFNALKTKNFEIAYRPGEPSAEFYKSVDMLNHLLKSIHRVPRIRWKTPAVWLSLVILYFLVTDYYGSVFWWLVLGQAIFSIWASWASNP
jgi:hypothetical protein